LAIVKWKGAARDVGVDERRQRERELIPEDCSEPFKALILDCWKKEHALRLTVEIKMHHFAKIGNLNFLFSLTNCIIVKMQGPVFQKFSGFESR